MLKKATAKRRSPSFGVGQDHFAGGPCACWSCRSHYTLELPDCHPYMENSSCSCIWKSGRLETGARDRHYSRKVAKVFEDAGLPSGVLNLVLGRGSVIGDVLTTHKDVAAVTFTGSNAVGQNIAKLATEHGKKFQLELGGKSLLLYLRMQTSIWLRVL